MGDGGLGRMGEWGWVGERRKKREKGREEGRKKEPEKREREG